MNRPTDPAVIEAIEAELMLSVYKAKRLARLRLLGLAPPPIASPGALTLLRTRTLMQEIVGEALDDRGFPALQLVEATT